MRKNVANYEIFVDKKNVLNINNVCETSQFFISNINDLNGKYVIYKLNKTWKYVDSFEGNEKDLKPIICTMAQLKGPEYNYKYE